MASLFNCNIIPTVTEVTLDNAKMYTQTYLRVKQRASNGHHILLKSLSSTEEKY